jgi:uncharacterized membrane protein YkvA (DUF1232 family)
METKASMDENYSQSFSEESFWEKLRRYAKIAGRDVVEKALALYYALKDKDTPVWAKGIITAALGYFIVPMDAIPDIAPFVGYADDLGALGLALASVVAHIKDEHRNRAREQTVRWFPEEETAQRDGDKS